MLSDLIYEIRLMTALACVCLYMFVAVLSYRVCEVVIGFKAAKI